MAPNRVTWRFLLVDDDAQLCGEVKEFLEGERVDGPEEGVHVEALTDFGRALDLLEAQRFDLVILDVRLGSYEGARDEEVGIRTLEAIQQTRFVPVVFYTGLPKPVQDLETPLVRVVEKTAGFARLLEVVQEVFNTRLPAVNRALVRHLETVQQKYMWDFVAKHWKDLSATADHSSLAYLLARRLAMSLSGHGIQEFAQELGDPGAQAVVEGRAHPAQYYILPPEEASPLAGDLFHGQIGDRTGHWLLLTPSCDLVTGREKAELVLLAACLLLTDQPEYQGWRDSLPDPANSVRARFASLLRNNRGGGYQPERYFFLPAAFMLPDMVVDFQQLVARPRGDLAGLARLASLDSPFTEALLARFTRYFGRLGIPDLDLDAIIERLGR